jgi:hypothetical protein
LDQSCLDKSRLNYDFWYMSLINTLNYIYKCHLFIELNNSINIHFFIILLFQAKSWLWSSMMWRNLVSKLWIKENKLYQDSLEVTLWYLVWNLWESVRYEAISLFWKLLEILQLRTVFNSLVSVEIEWTGDCKWCDIFKQGFNNVFLNVFIQLVVHYSP